MTQATDQQTGLLNREGGYAAAAFCVADAHRFRTALSVLWIDIDRFHAINYSFGHFGGDQIIQEVASRIIQLAGECGKIARMSGDEFIVLLDSFDLDAAKSMAIQIERFVTNPILIDGIQIYPTVSIGVAVMEIGEFSVDFLLRADKAKGVAKQHGGHKYLISGEPISPGGYRLAREELEIEAKLRLAIDTGCLQLHYQPIVRQDGSIEAIEALMRCHIDGVSIPPAKFIPVAEKTGLVNRLGEWTLSEGARVARQLMDAGFAIKVAVNISRAQLLNADIVPAVHSAIFCANIPPDLLELEITESLFLDPSPLVQANLREAREAGVGLAIDDFGTGFSSLASLKDLPATKIKLDRSFIIVLPEDRKAVAVVRAMAALGKELGLIVVAEGVETIPQRDCLARIGVSAIQGFVHSAPMPFDILFEWLQKIRQTNIVKTL